MGRRAPIGLLVAALAVSAALLFSYVSQLTFLGDSWNLLVLRPDWSLDTFLEPFNEHPIVLPALVFKVLLSVFGMDSALPFHTVTISLFLLCAVLLFAYMRRRVGDWAALAGAVLVLFLGAAYEDLLWEFQMGFFGSIAAGLGALLALDREDRRGDRAACALLVVATAFSTLGVPFVAATLAAVLLGPDRRRRLYVPLVPLAAYLLWWLVSGHSAGGQLGLEDIPQMPRYLFDVAAAGIASLLGQQPIDGSGQPPLLGQLLAVALGGGLAYWVARRRQIPPGLVVALVLLFSFWVLLALDRGPQRFSSRFQYPSAVFLLIVAAEALRGQRIPRTAAAALAAVTAAAAIGGISLLDDGYNGNWKPTANGIRATLAAVDIAGPEARPDYSISLPPSIFARVNQYREAKRRHGSPAFDEDQLLAAAENERQLADATLVGALGLRLRTVDLLEAPKRCRRIGPMIGTGEARLTPGAYQLENGSRATVTVGLRRFADNLPAQLGTIPASGTRSLRLPVDDSPRPWWLSTSGLVRACAL